MQGCALAVCSHEAQHNRFLQSLETLGHYPNVCDDVYVISECECDCVPFQLQNHPAQARPSFEAGGSTWTLCLNCFLPLNSNAQTRYHLSRKRHLCCVLQVFSVHVYAYFLNIPFLPLGNRLEWEGSYVWMLDFWHLCIWSVRKPDEG